MLLNWKVPSTNPKPNMMPAVELIVIHSKPIPMVFKMRSRYFLMPGSNEIISANYKLMCLLFAAG